MRRYDIAYSISLPLPRYYVLFSIRFHKLVAAVPKLGRCVIAQVLASPLPKLKNVFFVRSRKPAYKSSMNFLPAVFFVQSAWLPASLTLGDISPLSSSLYLIKVAILQVISIAEMDLQNRLDFGIIKRRDDWGHANPILKPAFKRWFNLNDECLIQRILGRLVSVCKTPHIR